MPKVAKASEPRAETKTGAAKAPAVHLLRWPVWASLTLTGLYVLLHLSMVPVALALWGGLLSALIWGQ